jgi:hypothetical protein
MTMQARPTRRSLSAGFDSDDIGGDCPDLECCVDAGDHFLCGHAPVQKQNINEGSRADGITIGLAGGRPERIVGSRKHSGLPRPR